jgi:ADP-ribose pyrophosphatase YjhB (NUDIX family)
MNGIRLSVKAIVIRNGTLLVIRMSSVDDDWFALPGGGQEVGETVHEALRRECREEIGSDVQIHGLRFVRDYIGKHHEFAATDGDVHQVELMFECTLESEPSTPTFPDTGQVGHAWLPVDDLASRPLYPRALAAALAQSGSTEPVYLGDCN